MVHILSCNLNVVSDPACPNSLNNEFPLLNKRIPHTVQGELIAFPDSI